MEPKKSWLGAGVSLIKNPEKSKISQLEKCKGLNETSYRGKLTRINFVSSSQVSLHWAPEWNLRGEIPEKQPADTS
jgi:hypothetical protein